MRSKFGVEFSSDSPNLIKQSKCQIVKFKSDPNKNVNFQLVPTIKEREGNEQIAARYFLFSLLKQHDRSFFSDVLMFKPGSRKGKESICEQGETEREIYRKWCGA